MNNLLSYSGFTDKMSSQKIKTLESLSEEKIVVTAPKVESDFNLGNLMEIEISEKAIPVEDILRPEEQVGLMQKKKMKEKSILLYDFDDSKILGYVNLKKFGNEQYFELQRTAAEKNYGPVISDFSLMCAYPEGVIPMGSIKPAALRVWYYYLAHREDVKKKPIPKEDRRTHIDTDLAAAGLSQEEAMEVINTLYFLPPTEEFKEIMRRGEENYPPKYNVDKNVLIKKAEKYFWNRYDNG